MSALHNTLAIARRHLLRTARELRVPEIVVDGLSDDALIRVHSGLTTDEDVRRLLLARDGIYQRSPGRFHRTQKPIPRRAGAKTRNQTRRAAR
jgi:hypothetical protein